MIITTSDPMLTYDTSITQEQLNKLDKAQRNKGRDWQVKLKLDTSTLTNSL